LDYLDWKRIIELKSQDVHKTAEGKQHMIDIKQAMNQGRILNTDLLDSSGKLNVIRWFNSFNKKED
jgi:hypothetical protein